MWRLKNNSVGSWNHCACLNKKRAIPLKDLSSMVPFPSCTMTKIFADEPLQFLLQTFQVVVCYIFPAAVNKNGHEPSSEDADFLPGSAANGEYTRSNMLDTGIRWHLLLSSNWTTRALTHVRKVGQELEIHNILNCCNKIWQCSSVTASQALVSAFTIAQLSNNVKRLRCLPQSLAQRSNQRNTSFLLILGLTFYLTERAHKFFA